MPQEAYRDQDPQRSEVDQTHAVSALVACTLCGSTLPPGARFCSSCGALVSPPVAASLTVESAEPHRESRFHNFAVTLSGWGNLLGGYVVGPIVFIVVLAGIVPATAGPPGVLSGPVGAVLTFGLNALWGILGALAQVVGWLGLLLIVVGLLAAIRRRAPWYTPLLGIAVFVVAVAAENLRMAIADFLGSASPWDGAAFWAAFVGTYIQLGARLPLWGNEIWNWPSPRDADYVALAYVRRLNVLHTVYMGTDTQEGFGKTIVSTVDVALFLALCLVGWQLGEWLGVAVAVAIGVTTWGIARGLVWMVGGAIVSLCVVFPLAAVLAFWEPDNDVRAAIASGAVL